MSAGLGPVDSVALDSFVRSLPNDPSGDDDPAYPPNNKQLRRTAPSGKTADLVDSNSAPFTMPRCPCHGDDFSSESSESCPRRSSSKNPGSRVG